MRLIKLTNKEIYINPEYIVSICKIETHHETEYRISMVNGQVHILSIDQFEKLKLQI